MKNFKATPKIAIGPGVGKVLWFDGKNWVTSDSVGDDLYGHPSIHGAVYSAWDDDLNADEANWIVDAVLDAIDLLESGVTFRLREKYSSHLVQTPVEFFIQHIKPILRPAQKET